MKTNTSVHITIPPGHLASALRIGRMLVRISIMPHHNIISGRVSSSIALRAFQMSKALAVGSTKNATTLYVLQASS